jgi:hypothetical protein
VGRPQSASRKRNHIPTFFRWWELNKVELAALGINEKEMAVGVQAI